MDVANCVPGEVVSVNILNLIYLLTVTVCYYDYMAEDLTVFALLCNLK